MEESTEEPVGLVERVCAIDIGKAGLVVCMRVPHATKPGRRVQEVREYATTTPALLDLADWLHRRQIELVAMEATSDYWKPVFYLLEAEGLQCWLLNAKHVKNVPGRPKTDKLDSVVSNLHGVSGRQMLQAMIDGQRDPVVLAEMAHGVMRRKIPQLREALTGHFDDHHAFLCTTMLRRIDTLTVDITQLDARIEELIAPFAAAVQKLDEITGIGIRSAQEIIAETGVSMGAFPTAAHLVSWAKFAPIDHQSAGKTKGAATGKGNPWLAATIGESVAALSRTDTFLGDRYRRLVRRRGKKRAIVAVGNSMLTIIWHLLADPDARYHDLGPGHYESKISKQRRQRDLVRQLEHLTGQTVILQPPPEQPAA